MTIEVAFGTAPRMERRREAPSSRCTAPERPMENFEEIRAMSEDEIVAIINRAAPNVVTGVDFWIRELSRRDSEASSERAERLTRTAVWLTIANLVVAVVAAVAAILALAS